MGKWSDKIELDKETWAKVKVDSQRTDVLIGDKTGKHCHVYDNKETGEVGIKHRGQCADCKDKKSDSGGSGK